MFGGNTFGGNTGFGGFGQQNQQQQQQQPQQNAFTGFGAANTGFGQPAQQPAATGFGAPAPVNTGFGGAFNAPAPSPSPFGGAGFAAPNPSITSETNNAGTGNPAFQTTHEKDPTVSTFIKRL